MRLFPAAVTLALTATLTTGATGVVALEHRAGDDLSLAAAAPSPQPDPQPQPGQRVRPRDSDPDTWQTSDRVIGPSRPTRPSYGRVRSRSKRRFQYQVRPGVRISSYQQTIGSRSVRYYLVRANWRTPGVGFNLAQPPKVDMVQTVRWMVHNTPHAVAGVNGDFFDIGETGAPLGLGVRAGSVEHGINSGWNRTFWVDRHGVPHVGQMPMTVSAPRYPHLGLTNLDSPQVRPGGIGVYDARWGITSGYAWTQGQRRNIASAHVIGHKIVAMRKVFASGTPVRGRYLVARGARAVKRLHRLSVGDDIWFAASAQHRPRTAVTGSRILLQGGKVMVTNNRELHPRTAVGIDPYHHWVYFLVVEGRQEFSDGFTMVELAQKLKRLGCTSGLNLDGGGSTTLAATRAGELRVLNSPSDGRPRKVANALAITYRKPR